MNGLKYVLLIHRMEHKELAEKIGATKAYIDNRATGRGNVSLEYKKSLEEIFNIPFEYFDKEIYKEDMKYILSCSKSCGTMTGLEFVLNIRNVQNQEIAEALGVHKQNINLWIKRKQDIPEKYLLGISKILGGVPSEYFQKQITLNDMKDILEYEISRESLIDNKVVKKMIINKVILNIPSHILEKIYDLSQEESRTVEQQAEKILTDYFEKL